MSSDLLIHQQWKKLYPVHLVLICSAYGKNVIKRFTFLIDGHWQVSCLKIYGLLVHSVIFCLHWALNNLVSMKINWKKRKYFIFPEFYRLYYIDFWYISMSIFQTKPSYNSKGNAYQVKRMCTFVWKLQYQLELKMNCMG